MIYQKDYRAINKIPFDGWNKFEINLHFLNIFIGYGKAIIWKILSGVAINLGIWTVNMHNHKVGKHSLVAFINNSIIETQLRKRYRVDEISHKMICYMSASTVSNSATRAEIGSPLNSMDPQSASTDVDLSRVVDSFWLSTMPGVNAKHQPVQLGIKLVAQ